MRGRRATCTLLLVLPAVAGCGVMTTQEKSSRIKKEKERGGLVQGAAAGQASDPAASGAGR